MLGKLSSDEIDQLLRSELVGRIGCHADGMTYVVPISYVYDCQSIYAYSAHGMKLTIMKKNPKVCFEVDNTTDLANWQSVICWGEFEELSSDIEKKEALQKLNSRVIPFTSSETMHITSEWPFTSQHQSRVDGTFFRIKITEKTGRFERSGDKSYYAS